MPKPWAKSFPDRREFMQAMRAPWFWTILGLTLGADLWVWMQAQWRVREEVEARFERRLVEIRKGVGSDLLDQVLVLRGGMGLQAAHDTLDWVAWHAYVQSLRFDRHPSALHGLGFAFHDQARGTAPVRFLEPFRGDTARLIGFDLYSDPVRREALDRARDSGEAMLSGPLANGPEFDGDTAGGRGLLLVLPTYLPGKPLHTVEARRAALRGFVFSPIRPSRLIAGSHPNPEARGMGLTVYDGPGGRPEALVYRSPGLSRGDAGAAPALIRQETTHAYGRTWTVRYESLPNFPTRSRGVRPVVLLVLGCIVSLSLSLVYLSLSTTRQRARRLAEEMTAELRGLQGNLERLVAQRTQELEAANKELGAEMRRREAREEQLRKAQKMEALGRLAGGIAHDFNNLLTSINGYAALALDGVGSDAPLRSNLEEIRRAGEMAATLTRQLLAYSRKQVLSLRRMSLNETAMEAGQLLERLLGGGITVTMRLDPYSGSVKIDPDQFQHALVQLALNARDAMPEGGTLSIETQSVELAEADASGLVGEAARTGEGVIPPGHYASLTVRDTGHGMTDDVKARLFEPYYSTKHQGRAKGTGLGLSMVYGIVRQSGGYIQVFSEPEKGTAFRILLPGLTPAPAEVA